jgi:hypothetical protein
MLVNRTSPFFRHATLTAHRRARRVCYALFPRDRFYSDCSCSRQRLPVTSAPHTWRSGDRSTRQRWSSAGIEPVPTTPCPLDCGTWERWTHCTGSMRSSLPTCICSESDPPNSFQHAANSAAIEPTAATSSVSNEAMREFLNPALIDQELFARLVARYGPI